MLPSLDICEIHEYYDLPSAIFAADIHLRADTPICRTDDFRKTQKLKLQYLFDAGESLDCPIFIAGDFGHRSFWPNELLSEVISLCLKTGGRDRIQIIAGQHDLPQHRVERWKDGALGVLHAAEAIEVCDNQQSDIWKNFVSYYFPFGQDITKQKLSWKNVAIAHMMVIENNPLWPGQEAPKANDLLKKYPEYDLIVTGDNHHPFVIEYEGRVHINPGSMMRQKSDQVNHLPRFYLWWAKTNQYMPIFWSIKKDAVTREHLIEKEEIDNRINAFVSRLQVNDDVDTDFIENLTQFIHNQKDLSETTINKIWQSIELGESNGHTR